MKELRELSKKQYDDLNNIGMLFELYPDATGDYDKDCADIVSQDDLKAVEKLTEVFVDVLNTSKKAMNKYLDMQCCGNCYYFHPGRTPKCEAVGNYFESAKAVCSEWKPDSYYKSFRQELMNGC